MVFDSTISIIFYQNLRFKVANRKSLIFLCEEVRDGGKWGGGEGLLVDIMGKAHVADFR